MEGAFAKRIWGLARVPGDSERDFGLVQNLGEDVTYINLLEGLYIKSSLRTQK